MSAAVVWRNSGNGGRLRLTSSANGHLIGRTAPIAVRMPQFGKYRSREVSPRRVVRTTDATADKQPMHLPLLSVQEHGDAMPAGVINRMGSHRVISIFIETPLDKAKNISVSIEI